MTEPTPPPRRPLATFLRSGTPAPPETDAAPTAGAPPGAADTGADTAPAPAAAPDPDNARAAGPPVGDPAPDFEDAAAHAPAPAVAAVPQATAPPPGGHDGVAAPTFARRGRGAPRMPARAWHSALLATLALLLGLQVLLADRARLAADARWRPLLGSLCGVLRCSLPAWREPAAFTMLDRDVRPLAAPAGVLQVQASFRNDGRWAQAWPWLQLSLSDADGRVIGSRVFAPQDYLGHAVAADDTLAPGQGAQVAFRVREPAASTAAFTFEFR